MLLLERINEIAIWPASYYLHFNPIFTIPFANSSVLMVWLFNFVMSLDPNGIWFLICQHENILLKVPYCFYCGKSPHFCSLNLLAQHLIFLMFFKSWFSENYEWKKYECNTLVFSSFLVYRDYDVLIFSKILSCF